MNLKRQFPDLILRTLRVAAMLSVATAGVFAPAVAMAQSGHAQNIPISPSWIEKVLHSFGSGADGQIPQASLIFDAAGDLYGTTWGGGTCGSGSVFELSPNGSGNWMESVLHSFCYNGTDGFQPLGSLIFDAAGNLYGTTTYGALTYGVGCGAVFEMSPSQGGDWAETVLHGFNGSDGCFPAAGLIFDAAGNLYSTTEQGGLCQGCGTVFELTPSEAGWTEMVLHYFQYNDDGYSPQGGLVLDAGGNLYGATGDGTVFELTPNGDGNWTETVLFRFDGADGESPAAGVIFDAAGNLYGTTIGGGAYGSGTVFELTPNGDGSWTELVLHSFRNDGTDGYYPWAGLILDADGNLYGTTAAGGAYGDGTVFELTRSNRFQETVLHNFSGADGRWPQASLIFDAAGNLYGTTGAGGVYDDGTVFELTPVYPCVKCSHGRVPRASRFSRPG